MVTKFLQGIALFFSLPLLLYDYFSVATGKAYNVGFIQKVNLLYVMIRNGHRIRTASHWLEHITMATQLLNISPNADGCVVECGTFKGGSAANLSLVCKLVGRRLHVFDSFAGLPQPSDTDLSHSVITTRKTHVYRAHDFAGGLAEVESNIARFGCIEVCELHQGYFQDSLPAFSEACVLAFIDVDLRPSLADCLMYLWPLLSVDCPLFTHEANHMEIAALFFDAAWWHEKLRSSPPGLIGAGAGLGIWPHPGGFRSSLGYTVKNPHNANFETVVYQSKSVETKTA